jgi:hypothetical protein
MSEYFRFPLSFWLATFRRSETLPRTEYQVLGGPADGATVIAPDRPAGCLACGWCSAGSVAPHREGWRPAVERDAPIIGACCPDCQNRADLAVAHSIDEWSMLMDAAALWPYASAEEAQEWEGP